MRDTSEIYVVDADGHVIEPADMWQEYVEARYRASAPRPVLDEEGTFCYAVGDGLVMRTASHLGDRPDATPDTDDFSPELRSGGWDAAARMVDMDSEGIDLSFLYPSVGLFLPEIPDIGLHAALCRAYNNWLHDYCQTAPDRLMGVALLPLNDVDMSIRELERCTKDLGFRGAFIRPNPYGGLPVQHPRYEPFWDCVESLGIPVTVHEGMADTLPTLGRDRSANPAIRHLMCHPFEQMAACAGLILGGVLERHPGLRFVFLESGCGWLPYWLERMDGHFENWSHHLHGVKHKPSEYFQRQCFISMDPDDEGAPSVLEQVGDECMVWDSDYPHTDHPFPGVIKSTLDILARAPSGTAQKVLSTNALRLYDLELPAKARA